LEYAIPNCVPVSQVNQAATKDDDGAEAETDGSRATAEMNLSDLDNKFCGWG
jgi:hypothetical protein